MEEVEEIADPSMEDEPSTQKITLQRYKCSACYKLYYTKEQLVQHMELSYHSVHQPKCGVCRKHCRSFESLREHLIGRAPKASCAEIFRLQGCELCMNILDSIDALTTHKKICRFFSTAPLESAIVSSQSEISNLSEGSEVPKAVALDCKMVGGRSDGTLNLCASVCLVDENENVLFHTYVQPTIPVTNYRYEITGTTEEHLRNAMPLEQVQLKILEILQNGESVSRLRLEGGKGRLLVGHSLEIDLECLGIWYPDHMLRDTAMYRPLMKTNLSSHSLKYLTRTYLGYEIQTGIHNPYEDAVAVMRLYKRMRAQDHPLEGVTMAPSTLDSTIFDTMKPNELQEMSSDELLRISRSNYKCWCLDSRPKPRL